MSRCMSEENQDPTPFFELDPNRPAPARNPLLQPIDDDDDQGSGLSKTILVAMGSMSVVGLVMLFFGLAYYVSSFVNASLMIPIYGVTLLFFVFAVLYTLRQIGEFE